MIGITSGSPKGSVIITILVMLVLVSLGAGVVMMFSSSSIQKAEHNIQQRVSSLAESGFRYAAGQYKSAGSLSQKFDRLESLNSEEVTLSGNDGSFTIKVFPYWFVTTADVSNSANLSLKVLGKFPDGFNAALPGSGIVMIQDNFYTYTGGSTSLGNGLDPDTFSLTLNKSVTLDRNTSVQLAFPVPSTQTVALNGSVTVTLSDDLLDVFPERNGLIQIFKNEKESSGIYRYRERRKGSVILSGIVPVEDDDLPLTLTSSSRIVLKKQAIINSNSSLGQGSVASEKGLSLNVFLTDELEIPADTPEPLDLGGSGPEKQEVFDDEENGYTRLSNWEFTPDDNEPESDKKTITTHEITTEFGEDRDSTQYVTFQNFSEVAQGKGYTAELINRNRLPASAKTTHFNGVWGNASDNIYFVGNNGTIMHFDGTTFSLMDSNSNKHLNAIWGLPPVKTSPDDTDHIFVVGNNGEALINEGQGWKEARHSRSEDLYAAWGISWGHFDAYGAKGINVYNWDSPSTADRLSYYNWYYNEFNHKANFRCLWATKHTYRYSPDYGTSGYQAYQNIIVGDYQNDGIIMHEFYEPAVILDKTPLRGVWGSSFSNIYAVGNKGAIYRNTSGDAPDYEGSGWRNPRWEDTWQGNWKKIPASQVPTNEDLNGIYGNSEDDFYVIGDKGTILYNKGNGFELVPTQGITTHRLNSIWGSDRTGIYAVGDSGTILFLGFPSNKIGGHILPLSKNAELSAKWQSTGKFLSYSIQTKTVWGDSLQYGASGICFRWHQPEPGKYAGYGLSFIRYDSSQNSVNDMIPDTIKPQYQGTQEKDEKLLLVLWEQYIQGGGEHRRWIAYKDISQDAKVVKTLNGTPRDLSTLLVRVSEKRVEGLKVNDIEIYYGNASATNQTSDNQYNNTVRNEYNPSFGTGSNTIKWPVFDLNNWTDCPDGPDGITCEETDAFTLVDNVSVSDNPVKADSSTQYWIVNPAADLAVLKNNFTIRTSRFTTPDSADFGSQSDRSEIALHVFGDIGDYGSQSLVSFTDFAVQLGVEANAVDIQSSFGDLQ